MTIHRRKTRIDIILYAVQVITRTVTDIAHWTGSSRPHRRCWTWQVVVLHTPWRRPLLRAITVLMRCSRDRVVLFRRSMKAEVELWVSLVHL
jgi:hypothetical protein